MNLEIVDCKTDLPLDLFVTEVKDHEAIKEKILGALDVQGKYGMDNFGQRVFNTDWHLGSGYDRRYMDIVRPVITAHLEMLKNFFGYHAVLLTNSWYQQYKKGDFHSEHTHPGCTFSSVYYVSLGEDNPKTHFRYRGKTYSFDVKEGSILTFPSFLIHGSPKNESQHTKTVIAFNANAIYNLPDTEPKLAG